MNILLLQLLLLEFVLDIRTERHRTFLFLTVLGMIATQGNKLLANWAATICFAFAILGMLHHTLHLLTRRQTTIGIATLTSMHQRLNATLYGLFASLLRIGLFEIGRRGAHIQIESQFLHFMMMTHFFFAYSTQIKVLLKEILMKFF